MLADLTALLDAVQHEADHSAYSRAVQDDNVLGKMTASTRLWAWKKLRELYALDPEVPVFRMLRRYWDVDARGRPLLAMLAALTRDALLRASVPVIADSKVGEQVTREDFKLAIIGERGARFSEKTMKSTLSNLISSWTQSGHLEGNKEKLRRRAQSTTPTTAFALAMGYLTGARGELLFSTMWTSILDTQLATLHDQAREASRYGWLTYRASGSIVDITFPDIVPQGELNLDE